MEIHAGRRSGTSASETASVRHVLETTPAPGTAQLSCVHAESAAGAAAQSSAAQTTATPSTDTTGEAIEADWEAEGRDDQVRILYCNDIDSGGLVKRIVMKISKETRYL